MRTKSPQIEERQAAVAVCYYALVETIARDCSCANPRQQRNSVTIAMRKCQGGPRISQLSAVGCVLSAKR